MFTLRRLCGSTIATLLIAALASAAQADEFDGCGTLFQGVECVLFSPDIGGDYLLDDTGGFSVGDRVHVIGERDPNCVSICQQGNGCIAVSSITAADCPCDFTSLPLRGFLSCLCGAGVAGVLPLSIVGVGCVKIAYRRQSA